MIGQMILEISRKLTLTFILALISLLLAVHGIVTGYAANAVILKLWNVTFVPLTGTTNYQIKVNVNYSLSDPSLSGQKINAIMKVHGPNGGVLKTSSFPAGFSVNNSGTTQFLTSIPKLLSRNLTTEIYFTDLNKSNVISNTIETLPHLENVSTPESLPTITNIT